MFRTKQLVIIGGPSSAGKSFLLKKIQRGDLPRLCEQIGLNEPLSWHYVNANKLSGINQPGIERLVVHYDFLSCHTYENGFNYLHTLISNTDHATVLTLCAPPGTLHQRITSRLIKVLISLFSNPKAYLGKTRQLRSLWIKRKMYAEKTDVHALYGKWFHFFNEHCVTNQWVINSYNSELESALPYNPAIVNPWIGIEPIGVTRTAALRN